MDEQKLLHRVQFLAHHIFFKTPEGIEFLKLMKVLHINTPTFPQEPRTIEAHGGAAGWAAFREGQLTLLRSLEELAKRYLLKLEIEAREKEKV